VQIIATMDARAIERLATKIAGFEREGPMMMAAALNSAGAELRLATVAAETKQTGLAGDVIDRAQTTIDASQGRLAFTILVRGGSVRLKYFGAKEAGGGVSARPWNRPSYYPGAFITSGRPGNRRPSPRLGGQVYTNVSGGKWRGHIKQVRPGLFIPTELTSGATAKSFEVGARGALEAISTRLAALLN
jgi:hypothetical protein